MWDERPVEQWHIVMSPPSDILLRIKQKKKKKKQNEAEMCAARICPCLSLAASPAVNSTMLCWHRTSFSLQ